MILKKNLRDLTRQAIDISEICRASQGQRTAVYRNYGQWIETGRAAGGLALANLLSNYVERLASYLCSMGEMRTAIDFEQRYGPEWLDRGAVAARRVEREWEDSDIDLTFEDCVLNALSYGCFLIRQIVTMHGDSPVVTSRLVPPWQFGVYNECVPSLSEQEAVCETIYYNRHEVWRRVRHLDDAEKLYRRIIAGAAKETGAGLPTTFMHQVLSTATLDVSLQNATRPQPGGIVQLSNDPNFATLGPVVAAELFPMHEIFVQDDERGDWTTIQYFEPDIIVAPRLKHTNLFVPNTLPYSAVRPTQVHNYFWGRSQIVDLQELQSLLTTTLDDGKRLMGQQIDKLLAFPGADDIAAERYTLFRAQGHISLPPGASVSDLTPKFPPEFLPYIEMILSLMDRVSGFKNILSGGGESGVRAGVHADTLLKTASPPLRKKALRIERQLEQALDVTLCALEAKDAHAYWTRIGDRSSEFFLRQLMGDRRISIDSHSTSPIFHDDHVNLLAWGHKAGIIGGDTCIEQMPFNHKELLLQRLAKIEEAKEKMLMLELQHPKAFGHHGGGHKPKAA